MAIADNANGVPLEEGDQLDRRAATEAMVVVPDGPGLFDVFSGTRGRYLVDVGGGRACTCDDFQYRGSERPFKHVRRVEMALGEREPPTDVRLDPTLRTRLEERGGR